MPKKDDGGPAFPVPDISRAHGLTCRDVFAMQAPPIPDWWPKAKLPPMVYDRPPFMNDAAKMDAYRYWNESDDEETIAPALLAEFKVHREEYKRAYAEYEAGVLAAHLKRLTDWQYAYADAMLAARGE